MSDDLLYRVWLSALTDVNLNSIEAMLAYFGSAKAAFRSEKGSFYKIEGILRKDAEKLENRDLSDAERIVSECSRKGITILTPEDERYPKSLKEIYAPPSALYVRGNLPVLDECAAIAVIGTRNASEYGLKMGRNFAYELAKCGAVIVSGLTRGIDAESAKGALAAGGTVIGVLGTAVDAGKNRLSAEVEETGALISEYPPETAPQKSFFRARNRIASGISRGVVVIEAPEKSGTRLFVAEALEQGKEIYALPSNADSETGAGTLRFLREGARLAMHGWHVAEDFPEYMDSEIRESYPEYVPSGENGKSTDSGAGPKYAPEQPAKKEKEKLSIDNAKPRCYIEISEIESILSREQKKIVEYINGNSRNVDDIIENTSLPASVVLGELTVLEIMGIIRRTPGGEAEIAEECCRK